jgi:hypothetical protein
MVNVWATGFGVVDSRATPVDAALSALASGVSMNGREATSRIETELPISRRTSLMLGRPHRASQVIKEPTPENPPHVRYALPHEDGHLRSAEAATLPGASLSLLLRSERLLSTLPWTYDL